jgi:CheY-like chemotaxis protein
VGARAEMIGTEEATPRVREHARVIGEQAARMGTIIRQLLDFARRRGPKLGPVNLRQLVGRALDLLAPTAEAQHVRLEYVPQGPPMLVQADQHQVQQVLANVVLNGIQSMRDGGCVRLRVDTVRARPPAPPGEPEGDYFCITVEDEGHGISPADLPHVFDPFFTTKATGRGLGLAATLGIVRSHGGWIRVESLPNLGSEFTVVFPAGSAAAPAPEPIPDAVPWRSDATVLVVDDDPAVARVATRMLESAGLRVLVARDGREALALHDEQQGEIALVLLDLNMPGLLGDEVFRALRRVDPKLPILFSSGYPEQEALDRLAGAGPIHFVQKPYRTQALLAGVRRALGS